MNSQLHHGLGHDLGFPIGGPIHVSVRFYLYGDEAASVAGAIEAEWRAWLDARFPSA